MGYTAESREREGIHNTGSCESIQKNGKVFVVMVVYCHVYCDEVQFSSSIVTFHIHSNKSIKLKLVALRAE
jgi:hypothetical protein